jgi:hypothetical protein
MKRPRKRFIPRFTGTGSFLSAFLKAVVAALELGFVVMAAMAPCAAAWPG